MPSILVHGGNTETREEKADELLTGHHIHHIASEKGRVGIKQIKELLPHLHINPPKGLRRGVLILEAQQMTPEAQNALLKTLEEPPTFLTFLLTTPHPRLLLPTVVSRCLLEAVGGEQNSQNDFAQEILSAPPGQRLALFEEKIGYRSLSALSFLDAFEMELGKDLTNNKNTHLRLIGVWETKKLLRNPSANVKLTVDRFLISW
ncbi:MAG: hypothetical protein BMS9Abin34_473 [Patescibacteria group bacterium]|nr:MAG: hypothetical protein BMS9Abin34_473 [Patescibacteria group bacterium]